MVVVVVVDEQKKGWARHAKEKKKKTKSNMDTTTSTLGSPPSPLDALFSVLRFCLRPENGVALGTHLPRAPDVQCGFSLGLKLRVRGHRLVSCCALFLEPCFLFAMRARVWHGDGCSKQPRFRLFSKKLNANTTRGPFPAVFPVATSLASRV